MKSTIITLLSLALTFAAVGLNAQVRALVPSEGAWVAVTDKGLVVLPHPLNATVLEKNVKVICKTPYLKVYVPTDAPAGCVVETLPLLQPPKPKVVWNATVLSNFTCEGRYLFSQLLDSLSKGDGVVVIYPLENTICKRVKTEVRKENETLVVSIHVEKIKSWLDICPPSKLTDVVVAWGKAKAVKVVIDGKVVLEGRNPRPP